MKQVLFDRAGEVHVDEVPAPAASPGCVLVRVAHSVISTGTESALYGRGGVASELAGNPGLLSRVVDEVRSAGVRGTVDRVRERLNERGPRGYSGSGRVVAVGEGVTDLRPGDRVAYGGEGHAEFVCVPRNLVARVPDAVPLEHAAITTIGSIALHGLRLAECGPGECVAIVGLGLVGQLAVALANSVGLRVAGGDVIASRVARARKLGLELELDVRDPDAARRSLAAWTEGVGADAALVCAGTPSSDPTRLAAQLCRDRGSLVIVGASGLDLERAPLYRKELRVRVSRSYGPGRYDPDYEDRGGDYPVGYVRWTQNRNFGAFLGMLERGALDVSPLLDHRVPLDDAADAYATLNAGPDAPLTALLDYADPGAEGVDAAAAARPEQRVVLRRGRRAPGDALRIGLIGCGGFARGQILPALRAASGVEIGGVCAATGVSAANVARLVDAAICTTDYRDLLGDDGIDAVVIATRHGLHHPIALAAARAGKPFHVEKPLALTREQCEEVVDAVEDAGVVGVIGFNRRSAPFVRELRSLLAERAGPAQLLIRVNAGPVPADHWTLDPSEGGGRLVGEGCHFLDLASHLLGPGARVASAASLGGTRAVDREGNVSVALRFPDGSLATLVYLSTGHRGLAKERIEAAWDGRSVVIDDFRRLETHGVGRDRSLRVQDKGVRAHFANFVAALRGESDAIAPVHAGLDVAARIDEIRAALADDEGP